MIGWMSLHDLQVVAKLADTVTEGGNIVEVGSMCGKSSLAWASSCHPSVKVYCVDIFFEKLIPNKTYEYTEEAYKMGGWPRFNQEYNLHEMFIENTKHLPNVIMVKGKSPENITYTGGPIDILFLDAHHWNPSDWDNICYFAPLVKIGGTICGHDYGAKFPDIIDNVARLEKMFDTKVVLYPPSQMWSVTVTRPFELSDEVTTTT